MIVTAYEISRDKAALNIEAMVSGMHLTFLNLLTNEWFWVVFQNDEDFLSFRHDYIDMIQSRKSLGMRPPVWKATFGKVKSSEKRLGLVLYLLNSENKRNRGGFTIKIMNEPETPLISFEVRYEEMVNLIDESAKLLDIKSNYLKNKS